MNDDEILRENPELEFIRQWAEAFERQQYEVALSILVRALSFAEKRNSDPFVEHFIKLRALTQARLALISADPSLTEANLREREAAEKLCSFCGRRTKEVLLMVAGAYAFICDQCIRICSDILASKRSQ